MHRAPWTHNKINILAKEKHDVQVNLNKRVYYAGNLIQKLTLSFLSVLQPASHKTNIKYILFLIFFKFLERCVIFVTHFFVQLLSKFRIRIMKTSSMIYGHLGCSQISLDVKKVIKQKVKVLKYLIQICEIDSRLCHKQKVNHCNEHVLDKCEHE